MSVCVSDRFKMATKRQQHVSANPQFYIITGLCNENHKFNVDLIKKIPES